MIVCVCVCGCVCVCARARLLVRVRARLCVAHARSCVRACCVRVYVHVCVVCVGCLQYLDLIRPDDANTIPAVSVSVCVIGVLSTRALRGPLVRVQVRLRNHTLPSAWRAGYGHDKDCNGELPARHSHVLRV